MQTLSKQVLIRFIESGVSGALATVATITYFTGIQTWEQLKVALTALFISLMIGFINGVIMAGRKYFQGPSVPASTAPLEGLVE